MEGAARLAALCDANPKEAEHQAQTYFSFLCAAFLKTDAGAQCTLAPTVEARQHERRVLRCTELRSTGAADFRREQPGGC
jgi:hypothetical protein